MVLPCQEEQSGIRVDFIFSFSPYESEALKRVRRFKMGEVEVCFASVEDLIIHKIVAGRPRDLDDVRSVLIKNPHLDTKYVTHWLSQFDATLSNIHVQRFKDIQQSLS